MVKEVCSILYSSSNMRYIYILYNKLLKQSQNKDTTCNFQSQGEAEPTDSSTLAERQKTESMTNLLDELNRMSLLIDVDKNPQWKTFIHGK